MCIQVVVNTYFNMLLSAFAVVLSISSLHMISSIKKMAENSPQISELESVLCETNVEFILYWNQRYTDEPVCFPIQLTSTITLLTKKLNIPYFGNRLSKLTKQHPVNVLALKNEVSVETTHDHLRYEIYVLRLENSNHATFFINGKYLITYYQVL